MLLRSVAKKNNLVEKCNILGAAFSEKLCIQYLLSVMVLYHVSEKLTTFFAAIQSHSVFGFSDIFADRSRAQLAPTLKRFVPIE